MVMMTMTMVMMMMTMERCNDDGDDDHDGSMSIFAVDVTGRDDGAAWHDEGPQTVGILSYVNPHTTDPCLAC
eukprot:762979-Hanusia_phi.AAC.2